VIPLLFIILNEIWMFLVHTTAAEVVHSPSLLFEFRVLEIALEVVTSYYDSKVDRLEKIAYPALDETTGNDNTGFGSSPLKIFSSFLHF
jgi:hypothetical protein